jgi:hypothetical protein
MKRRAVFLCLLAACVDARLKTIPPAPLDTNVRHEIARDVCVTTPKAVGIKQLDAMFLMDTTGSMTEAIVNLQDNVRMMLESLKLQVADVRFAVARFDDYRAICALASGDPNPTDTTFTLLTPLTNDGDVLQMAVAKLTRADGRPAGNGADGLACGYEALYQAATGAGLDVNKNGVYDGDDALMDIAPMPAGWRMGSKKVIVMMTDAAFAELEKPRTRGDATWIKNTTQISQQLLMGGGATKDQTIAALNAAAIKVVGVSVGTAFTASFGDLQNLATATGTFTFSGFSPIPGDFTQLGSISPGGPLVFRTDSAGNPYGSASMAKTIVESLSDIVNATDVKITLTVTNESKRTEEQVQLTIDPADTQTDVPPETDVCFTVHANWPSDRKAPLPNVHATVDSAGTPFADQPVSLAD